MRWRALPSFVLTPSSAAGDTFGGLTARLLRKLAVEGASAEAPGDPGPRDVTGSEPGTARPEIRSPTRP